jgi:hypothetical protein
VPVFFESRKSKDERLSPFFQRESLDHEYGLEQTDEIAARLLDVLTER